MPRRASLSQPMAVLDRNRLNFSWLLTLRWSSIAGQLATILGVAVVLHIELPLLPLLAIVGAQLLSNFAAQLWLVHGNRVHEWHIAATMVLDVAMLTGLLYFTGGPSNPFSFLYLVQIALAAVVLRAYWTWALVGLSFGAFGLLLLGHRDLQIVGLGETGMWVALGVASAFIVHFLLRVTGALAVRERELADVRERAARQVQLGSLATMAAGAAHELATPLGTIALVAKELERHLDVEPHVTTDQANLEDVRLIRAQVARCRRILDQMAGRAGASTGEPFTEVSVQRLLELASVEVRSRPAVQLSFAGDAGAVRLELPAQAVAQAVHSVITNAQDASDADQPVQILASINAGAVCIEVCDRGTGMSQDTVERAVEPFFTTKSPNSGMGLGLFLTRAVFEQLGGQLRIDSKEGDGTRVDLTLPLRGEILRPRASGRS